MIGADGIPYSPWPAFVVAAPLVAACAMIVWRRGSAAFGVLCSLLVSGLVLALAHQVFLLGPQHMEIGGWKAPLGIQLRADGPAVGMLCITALVGVFASLYAAAYFAPGAAGGAPHGDASFFWPLWMILWAALNALFLSADIFNLYVALEIVGLSSVTLVALSHDKDAVPAALRYLLVSLLGSLSYLMGVALLYGAAGTLGVSSLAGALTPAPFAYAALSLMTAGLVMKSALFPLHFWLPPAHANAPAPVSALLSALVVEASFYVLLRLWFEVFGGILPAGAALLPGLLGAAAIFWGSVQALTARRLKLLIAYSTVAQMGYLFLVFPLGTEPGAAGVAWNAALYFIVAHACAKAAVFLAAGNVLRAFGHDRIRELRGAVQHLPVSMFAFGIAGVSLVGLPPSGGFIAKWLFLSAALRGERWGFVAVILLGGFLATAYIFRFFSHAFRYVPEGPRCGSVPRSMEWSALALALFSIVLGLTATPVLDWMQTGLAVMEPPEGGCLP